MSPLTNEQVREVTQKPEQIRCVSIIGARGHGKTSLARNLVGEHAWSHSDTHACYKTLGELPDAGPDETTESEVHVLTYLHTVPVYGPAGAQSHFHPDALRAAVQKIDDPFIKVDARALVSGQPSDTTALAEEGRPMSSEVESRPTSVYSGSAELTVGASRTSMNPRVSALHKAQASAHSTAVASHHVEFGVAAESGHESGKSAKGSRGSHAPRESSSNLGKHHSARHSRKSKGPRMSVGTHLFDKEKVSGDKADENLVPELRPSGGRSRTASGNCEASPAAEQPMAPTRTTGPARGRSLRKAKTARFSQVPPTLVYVLDTPGHADFAADMASSLRLSDGAIVVVDMAEGCLAHLAVLLRHSLAERVRPVLFVGGLDRCILDLRMSPEDMHTRLRSIVDGVNASLIDDTDELLGNTRLCPEKGDTAFGSCSQDWGISIKRFASQYAAKFGIDEDALAKRLWDDTAVELPYCQDVAALCPRPSSPSAVFNPHHSGHRSSEQADLDLQSKRITVIGNETIIGGQAIPGHVPPLLENGILGRDVTPLGLGSSPRVSIPTSPRLPETASGVLAHNLGASVEGPAVSQTKKSTLLSYLVLAPLAQLVRAMMATDWSKIDPMLAALGVDLNELDRAIQGADLVKRIMGRWLNLSDVVLDMVKTQLPSPLEAQSYRAENLYAGSGDDIAATAIRNCDPQGPLMVCISRMLPSPSGQIYGLGRVFSGTLVEGTSVWLKSSQRKGDINDSHLLPAIDGPSLPSEPMLKCATLQCGNICAIHGVEQFLLKSGTITDLHDGADLTTLNFRTVRPVVRIAVNPAKAADLPKLTEALRRLSKTDPLLETSVEEWGEHVLRGSGRRHVDTCLEKLQAYLAPAEFEVVNTSSDTWEIPGTCGPYHVAYRETVHATSSTSFSSKSPNNLCQLEASAEPLGERLCQDIEAGLLRHGMEADDRMRSLVDHYSWNRAEASRIWCFGPGAAGANFVVDGTPECITSSTSPDHLELQEAVAAAYQWTTHEGALCEEPMRGIRFTVKDVRLLPGSMQSGSGQIIGTARRCFMAAQLGAAPGLQEPILQCEVLCPSSTVKAAACAILAERSGVFVSETPVDHGEMLRLLFELPVASALDLDSALAAVGCTHPAQSSFSHWSSLPGDPSVPGRHRDLVLGLRRWRHLEAAVPTPEAIFGPGSKLTPADVFADDLLDLIVPA